jgi:hypothetical protein
MSSKRYTVVFDVEGGRYIAQVVAPSMSAALEAWARAERDETWVRLLFGTAERFETWWRDSWECFGEPTRLTHLTGVWDGSALADLDGREVLAHYLVIEGGVA